MLHLYKTKALLHMWSPWILGWPDPPACIGLGLGFQESSAAPAVGSGHRAADLDILRHPLLKATITLIF